MTKEFDLSKRVTEFVKSLSKRPDVVVGTYRRASKTPAKQLGWEWDGFPDDVRELYNVLGGIDLRWRFFDRPELGFLHFPKWSSVVCLEADRRLPACLFDVSDPLYMMTRDGDDVVIVSKSGDSMRVPDFVDACISGRMMVKGEEVTDLSDRVAASPKAKKPAVGDRVFLRQESKWERGTVLSLSKTKPKCALVELDLGQAVWANLKHVTPIMVDDAFERLLVSDLTAIPVGVRIKALSCLAGNSWTGARIYRDDTLLSKEQSPAMRTHGQRLLRTLSAEDAADWVRETLSELPNTYDFARPADEVSIDQFDSPRVNVQELAKMLTQALAVRLMGEDTVIGGLPEPVTADEDTSIVLKLSPGATRLSFFDDDHYEAAKALELDPLAALPTVLK